jgi:RES domain
MSLWKTIEGELNVEALQLKPWRVVEAQHLVSTRSLVDSVEEHEILESLIESSKPPIDNNNHNYLIFTPFRYPPLAHGSRFGTIHEPSLWYGSLELETAFAEVSYYLQKFRHDTLADLGELSLVHTAFKTNVITEYAIRLEKPPFQKYREYISSKDNYEYSQALGRKMREASVTAFTFYSARTLKDSLNVGIFSSDVFVAEKNHYIFNQQTWLCFASEDKVEFTRSTLGKKMLYTFSHNFAIPPRKVL